MNLEGVFVFQQIGSLNVYGRSQGNRGVQVYKLEEEYQEGEVNSFKCLQGSGDSEEIVVSSG